METCLKMKGVLVLWLCTHFYGVIICNSLYKGHQVHRILPANPEHLKGLRDLQHGNQIKVEFWTDPRQIGQAVDIQVAGENLQQFQHFLQDKKIPHKIIFSELESSINEHLAANTEAKANRDATRKYNWEEYYTYEEIMDWLETRALKCGERCETFSIGSTYEGRDMRVIKVTNGNFIDKPIFWIDAGIHAREWIAPAVATYFIDQLIENYQKDANVTLILDNYDVHVLPLMNCDGYEYTHNTDRLWRKSMRPNEGSECIGTDINRNFDHEWGTVGVSHNPCSNTYCGPNEYSEVEAENVANYVSNLTNVDIFITLHSYGQLWMAPWGYTTSPPNNKDELIRAGKIGADALESVYGTLYDVGSASEILYESSGTSRDWAKGVPGIEYVYTIELRDEGEYGFLLPPDQILPCARETWIGIMAFTNATLSI